MLVAKFIEALELLGYKVGNIRKTEIYNKIEDKEVNLAGYARISNEDSKETSIVNQIQTISLFTKEIKLDNESSFYRDQFSGTYLERPEYKKLICDIENKKVNIVVVTKLNRLGRDASELNNVLYKEFYKNNVIFVCIQDKIINSMDNRLLIQQEAVNAEKYCKDTSHNVRAALNTRMKMGSYIGSKAPFGYIIYEVGIESKKRILLKVNDGSEQVAEEIFMTYLGGKGYEEIANTLNAKYILSPNGGKWNGSTIKQMLENPLYAGILAQGRYRKEGYKNSGLDMKVERLSEQDWIKGEDFEGIISKEIFYKVQEEKSRRGSYRKKGQPNLFAGLIKCGDCSKALVYKSRDEGYKCASSQNGGGCSTHFVKENELLVAIKEELTKIISMNTNEINSRIIHEIKKQLDICNPHEKMKNFKKQVKSLEIKTNKDYELFTKGVITQTTFKIIDNKNEWELLKIERLRENFEGKMKNLTKIQDMSNEIIEKLIKMEKINNTFLRILIKEITIFESGLIKIIWNFSNN